MERSPLSDLYGRIVVLFVVAGVIQGMLFSGWFLLITAGILMTVLWVFNNIDAGVAANKMKIKEKEVKCCSKTRRRSGKS